jgi:hypothetical protein
MSSTVQASSEFSHTQQPKYTSYSHMERAIQLLQLNHHQNIVHQSANNFSATTLYQCPCMIIQFKLSELGMSYNGKVFVGQEK